MAWSDTTYFIHFCFGALFLPEAPCAFLRDLWRRLPDSARLVLPSQICPTDYNTAKQKNWEFWHVLHTSVVEVNGPLRTCRSLTASFWKESHLASAQIPLYWVGKNLHCTRSKRTDMEGKNGDSCKKRWHELGKHLFFKAHAIRFLQCTSIWTTFYIMEANWNHSWSHFKICNFSCPVRKTSTINALCLWPFWQGSMDVPHQKIQQFNAMFTMSSCIYPNFLLGLGNGNIQSPAPCGNKKTTAAQLHWDGTQPSPKLSG